MRYLLVALGFLLSMPVLWAQVDDNVFIDSEIFNIDNTPFELRYRLLSDSVALQNFQSSKWPIYIFPEAHFEVTRQLLHSYTRTSLQCTQLERLYLHRDSLNMLHETALLDIQHRQQKRISLYQEAYEAALNMNGQLIEQLQRHEKLSLKAVKRKSRTAVVVGILSGLVGGMVVGMVASG